MVEVELLRLEPEGVQPHLLLQRAQRGDRERLRLAALEERRAVAARQQPGLDVDVADLVGAAAVRAQLAHGDALADRVLLELGERLARRRACGRRSPRTRGRRRSARAPRPRRPSWRPGGRACPGPTWPRRPSGRTPRRSRRTGPRRPRGPRSRPSACRRPRAARAGPAQSFLISRVRDVERVEDLGLGHLVGARLDHEDGLLGAGDDEVEVAAALGQVGLARVDDEVAVDLADAHRADGRRQRDRRDHQRRGGAVHREDVVGVDVVHRERDADQLRLVAPVLGEQRAQRAVDHARGERRLGARAALALEERAGDLARGVHALLDVDREGQEVRVAEVAHGRGAEDHGVALTDDDGAACLLGELARLEGDLGAGDVDRNGLHGIGIHIWFSPLRDARRIRRPASLLRSLVPIVRQDSLRAA